MAGRAVVLGQRRDEFASSNLSLRQSGGLRFEGKADKAKIQASLAQRLGLLCRRQIEEMDRGVRLMLAESGQHPWK